MGTPFQSLPRHIQEAAKASVACCRPATAPRTTWSESKPASILDELDTVTVTIPGAPMGKPRMTQRDKWAKRECVMRYRDWADSARSCISPALSARLPDCQRLDWVAYLPIPPSWSKRKQAELAGKPHRAKPDRDNIDKAVLDALLTQDSGVHSGTIAKLWDDGKGPRLVLTLHFTP
jgi:Holliday junction resolvase RusA-like endonuclease